VLLFLLSASYGQEIFPELEGDALLNALRNEYKTTTVLSYGDARRFMFRTLNNSNDSVICVYTGHALILDPGSTDPIQDLLRGGNPNGINTEHVYPQSKGAGNGQPRADLHHLFPVRVNANSARGSSPFAEVPDNTTRKWYYLDTEVDNIPSTQIDAYSELGDLEWEPQESFKGNVARAMFYFYTMYTEQANSADRDYFENQREVFCQWHFDDPVDDAERERSAAILEVQDDENPFILDCTLVERSYCMDTDLQCVITSIENPLNALEVVYDQATDELVLYNVPGIGEYRVQVLLASGQILQSRTIDAMSSTIRVPALGIQDNQQGVQIIRVIDLSTNALIVKKIMN